MSVSASSLLKVAVVLPMVIIVPGCETGTWRPANLNSVKPIPRRAGLHISQEFRETASAPQYVDVIPVVAGETMVDGVREVVRCAFQESGEIASVEGNLSDQGYDVVVIPEITLLELKHGAQLGTAGGGVVGVGAGRVSAILQMKWRIEDRNRDLLWLDTVTTTHRDRCYTRWCFPKVMEKAIYDQFQQALEKMTGYDWWTKRIGE